VAYTESLATFGALAVVGGLVLASRWVFSTSARDRRMARERTDLGLLVAVTTTPGRESAQAVAARLLAQGVRATVAPEHGPDRGQPLRVSAQGRLQPQDRSVRGHQVLVFPDDLDRARQLLRR
jgi:hypothetical protein